MESWSLYRIEFRDGPTISVVSVAISTAMLDACEVANGEAIATSFADDRPAPRVFTIGDIETVTEAVRPVWVSSGVLDIERREHVGGNV